MIVVTNTNSASKFIRIVIIIQKRKARELFLGDRAGSQDVSPMLSWGPKSLLKLTLQSHAEILASQVSESSAERAVQRVIPVFFLLFFFFFFFILVEIV